MQPPEILAKILPNRAQTLFLGACLWTGQPAVDSWVAWKDQVGDPIKEIRPDSNGYKRLLPLLYPALSRNMISVNGFLLTCLHTAQLMEEGRRNMYRRICGELLQKLADADIKAILLKGAALADTVYEKHGLRHCHDIDMLMDDVDPRLLFDTLLSSGFRSDNGVIHPSWTDLEFVHHSGLPMKVHQLMFESPGYIVPFKEILDKSQFVKIAEVPTRILSPAYNLLQVCLHAFFCAAPPPLTWVCDAWLLINRNRDLDWTEVLKQAKQHRLEAALFHTLEYLADALKAPVPSSCLNQLRIWARSYIAESLRP